MELILARHGNTFSAGQAVVWVGSQNDLPLVATGEVQAQHLGQALLKTDQPPTSVYTGPLLRMTTYAKIILNELNLNLQPIIDIRLNEIDYGDWSGLTKQEVCEKFGVDVFEQWEKKSIWPTNSHWKESAQLVTDRIQDFAKNLTQQYVNDEKILVVASNGCLRYFLSLIPGELQRHIDNQTAKIATGNLCKLTYQDAAWKLNFWDLSPQQMLDEQFI